jgi:hypothetical protein
LPQRPSDLQTFLDRSQAAIMACLPPAGEPMRVARRIDEGLRQAAEQAPRMPNRLPVGDLIPSALAAARAKGGLIADLADAFAGIESQLKWERRWTAKPSDVPFYDGHANATIVGPDGLEKRDDIWIGVSLLAPHIRYPDHHHAPQEIYVALSPGDWLQGDNDSWVTPGIGGYVYNKSDLRHAMRSHDRPLLAIWSLWVTDRV